jgi:hypothetical protein
MRVSKITKKFFDFYSIVELYLRCGGYRDIGYKTYPTFVAYRIEERIRMVYEETVHSFYDEVFKALVKSIYLELKDYPDACYGNMAIIEQKLKKKGLIKSKIRTVKAHPYKYAELAHLLFTVPRWIKLYGGKKWASGTRLLIDLKNVKTTEDKVYWIDRVLDLYHNTGHMLNKTKFKYLSQRNLTDDYVTPLDLRANATTILDFLPYNSSKIRKLVIPRRNILTSSDSSVKI